MIDFNNLIYKSSEIVEDWEDLIYENEGSFSSDSQILTLDMNGVEVVIDFTLSVVGDYWYTPATYLQPEEGETTITRIDVDIENVYLDDCEVILDKNLKINFEILVKKYLNE